MVVEKLKANLWIKMWKTTQAYQTVKLWKTSELSGVEKSVEKEKFGSPENFFDDDLQLDLARPRTNKAENRL